MADHVSSALFVYTEESSELIDPLRDNPFGVDIAAIAFEELAGDPASALDGVGHIVVSGSFTVIRAILDLAMQHDCSVGIVPLRSQRDLAKTGALPVKTEAVIDLALRQDTRRIDLIRCNGIIVLSRVTIGRLPLIDSAQDTGRWGMAVQGVKSFVGLRLMPFQFVTARGQKIKTAACGCMLVPHRAGRFLSGTIGQSSTVADGLVTLIISAPSSIAEYLKFLIQRLNLSVRRSRRLPSTLGYIQSSRIDIESEVELVARIDSEVTTRLPVHCETLHQAISVNIGESLHEEARDARPAKEKLDIRNLPKGKEELAKAAKKTTPFFSYASEERFRDLFLALRDDARTDSIYLTLMVLSTMLATIGLYQNSTAVVIGAMLLAPLMAPIISLSMGVLRQDENLFKYSILKILLGVSIALLAAVIVTLLFPYKPITHEMTARLNPTLLDLAVAIVAGIAGAYTKAYKEILQSLAGVAIAVALVPPLAVAGIGLGRLDPYFFSQAFLLFLTNLIGILLAASFTFRVLGYSAAVHDRRSLRIVTFALVLIAIPLYLSYQQIVEATVLEKGWQQERFFVNGKYLIVQSAKLTRYRDKNVMTMDILARDVIARDDLTLLKKKIQTHFDKRLVVRAKIIYIP